MAENAVLDAPEAGAEAVAEAPTCKHHWVIESPNGEFSRGSCKVCGEEKQFRNSTPDNVWESDGSFGRWRNKQRKDGNNQAAA
jgi:hypothetical protein